MTIPRFLRSGPSSVHIISTNDYYTADKIEVIGDIVKLYWWDGYTYRLQDTVSTNDIEEDSRRFSRVIKYEQ